MNAPNDNAGAKGLRRWWLSPPRPGMQRIISPWEYRHLRAWAGVRIVGAVVSACLGVVVVSAASTAWAIFGALLLLVAAANLSFAYWELTIARSGSART
jgi:hypothetical protein